MAWALILISGLLEVAFAAAIQASNGFTRVVSAAPGRLLCIAFIVLGIVGLQLQETT